MIPDSPEARENLARVRDRIARAAARAGRGTDEITLIAVSKTHSAEQIRELHEAGQRHFGENRVQEWESKRAQLSDLAATWHMIGHLQSNKAAKAVRLFDTVDSIDSLSLAERLDRSIKDFIIEQPQSPEKIRVLIEVKLDPGETKSGVSGEEVSRLVQAIRQLPHLDLRGLMGVPPTTPKMPAPIFDVSANCATQSVHWQAKICYPSYRWACPTILK